MGRLIMERLIMHLNRQWAQTDYFPKDGRMPKVNEDTRRCSKIGPDSSGSQSLQRS